MSDRSTKPRAPRERNLLSTYLGEVGRHDLMSPDEERERAQEIARLRGAYWRALLSHPPLLAAIAERLPEAELIEPVEPALVDRARKAARAVRDRDTRANWARFHAAIDELATALVYGDPECKVAERVRADVLRLAAGDAPTFLDARKPPRGSGRFRSFAGHIARAHAELQRARERFVQANLRLVIKMALRYRGGLLPLADLVQEGNLGLMKAVDRFDVRKGFRFSTYASWWIRHAMTRAAVNTGRTVRIPAHLDTSHAKIARERRRLSGTLGRVPTPAELAQATGLTAEQVLDAEQAVGARTVSMEVPRGDPQGDRTLRDVLPDPVGNPVPDELEREAVAHSLRQAFDDLSPIEVDILRKRFGLDGVREHTLAEVGRNHQLSRERIRQIQNQALAKVRSVLRNKGVGPSA